MSYFSDTEVLKILQDHIDQRGLLDLTYDDRRLYEILTNTELRVCPLCGGTLKHSIHSVCAGHGDFPRYLTISCDTCSIEHDGCIDYGSCWQDVERDFVSRCTKIAHAVSNQLKK